MSKQTHEYKTQTFYLNNGDYEFEKMAKDGWRVIDTTSWPCGHDPSYRQAYVLWERPVSAANG
jgi:hypothetical protein